MDIFFKERKTLQYFFTCQTDAPDITPIHFKVNRPLNLHLNLKYFYTLKQAQDLTT